MTNSQQAGNETNAQSTNNELYGYLCFAHFNQEINRKQRIMFENMVDAAMALTIGESGTKNHVFFIPIGKEETKSDLEYMINTIGGKFSCTELHRSENQRLFLANFAVEEFKTQFNDLAKETEKIDMSAQRPVKFRNHLKKFQVLRNKAKMYSDLLAINTSKFNEKIEKELQLINRGILATK